MAWAPTSDLNRSDHQSAELALEIASDVLTNLTGRLYSEPRQVVEMYETRTTLAAGAQFYGATQSGIPLASTCSSCVCSHCGVVHRIRLRGQPVRNVIDVIVNGRKLLPTEYLLLDHSVLGFLTSEVCNTGCVTVRYRYGTGIPAAGRYAAVKLANELVESLDPNGDCSLPQRVTSISRQGVSWTLLDPQDFLNDGRTGIYAVDLFLATYNPAKAKRPARVFSPDRPRAYTVVQEYPALADVLLPDDMVVVPGAPSGWLVTDEHAVQTLSIPTMDARAIIDGAGEVRLTGTPIPGSGISFLLPADVTAKICYGAHWQLIAHDTLAPNDELLLEGEARTL